MVIVEKRRADLKAKEELLNENKKSDRKAKQQAKKKDQKNTPGSSKTPQVKNIEENKDVNEFAIQIIYSM